MNIQFHFVKIKTGVVKMANKKRRSMFTSKLKCSECGSIFPIMRNQGMKREFSHVKHMWCFSCKKETGFIENTSEKNWKFM